MGLPLEGLRVIDLTQDFAGPFCTMIPGGCEVPVYLMGHGNRRLNLQGFSRFSIMANE